MVAPVAALLIAVLAATAVAQVATTPPGGTPAGPTAPASGTPPPVTTTPQPAPVPPSAAPPPIGLPPITIDGHGSGHGAGMSQYGAYGYALREGRDAAWILGHYFTGTQIGHSEPFRMRVLLKRSTSQKICGATRATDATGRRITLVERRMYRFVPAGPLALRAIDQSTGRPHGPRLVAPARVTGGLQVCLRGRALNGVSNGSYRGAIMIARAPDGLLAVNDVHIRHYLFGVVAAEMPSTWPAQALGAQAIAARSYALAHIDKTRAFDVYADTRSQLYQGVAGETAATDAAVLQTSGMIVTYGGQVAETVFSSSSGGTTASNEEAFGTAPLPYLRSVDDPYDSLSPLHTWTRTIPAATVQQQLGTLVPGTLQSLAIATAGPTGRVLSVTITGSAGVAIAPGSQVEALLQLPSMWFSIRPF